MAVRIVCFLLSVRFMNFCVGILLHLLFFPRLLSQMHTFMCQRRPGKFCLLSVTINHYMDFCLKSNRQNKTECTVFVHSAIKCTNLLILIHFINSGSGLRFALKPVPIHRQKDNWPASGYLTVTFYLHFPCLTIHA